MAFFQEKVFNVCCFYPKLGPLVWNRTIIARLSVVCSTIELQGELTWYQRLDSNQPHLVLQTSALPDELRWHIWRKAEESNPIPVKRTQFSRLVAGPSQLHYFPYTWCPRGDLNSQNLVSKTSTYTNSVTRAKFVIDNLSHYTPSIKASFFHWSALEDSNLRPLTSKARTLT